MSTETTETPDELSTAMDAVLPDPEVQVDDTEEAPKGVAAALRKEQRQDNAAQRKADREAGRQSVLEAANKRAMALGFKSLEEMFAAQKKAEESGGNQRRVHADAIAQKDAEIASLQRQIRGFKSRISTLETELQLRNIAYESDVNPDDIDYAISRVHSAYKSLDDDAAKGFDPKKFIGEDLKSKKPGIFRQALAAKAAVEETKPVQEQPVTTAPAGSAPRPAVGNGAAEPAKRATEMNRTEYHEALRRMGIKNPATQI